MKQEIVDASKESKALAVPTGSWGAVDALTDQSDFIIPNAMVMQKMSGMLEDHADAKSGDIRDSLDGSLLAKEGEAWPVIIVTLRKEWRVYTSAGKRLMNLTQPLNAETANLPWEFEFDGETVKRKQTYVYSVLPANNLDAVPYEFSLQSTSVNTAKSLNTTLLKWSQLGKSSAAFVVNFTTKKEQNDYGTYWVTKFSVGRETTPEEQATAFKWFQRIQSGAARSADAVGDSEELI